MQNGLLSIIMVSYNHGPYLNESIQSIISQTYKNWELIIVDDGSRDNSLEIARDYARKFPNRIKSFIHPEGRNLGISSSYILGLSLCQGEFIGFLEPDDIWEDNNAEIKINLLLNQNVDLVYSDVKPIGDPESIAIRNLSLRVFRAVPANVAFEAFSRLSIVNIVPSFSTVIVKKKILQNLKFISNKRYEIILDWFVWFQAGLKTKFLFIPQRLVKWRLYKSSYFNEFILRKGEIKTIIFNLEYRFMVFRKLILSYEGSFWKKFRILSLFCMGFIKVALIFILNKLEEHTNKRYNFIEKIIKGGLIRLGL